MEPGEISKRADRDRERNALKRSRKDKPAVREKPVEPLLPESRRVFNLVSTRYMNMFLWYFVVLTLGIVFFALHAAGDQDWALYPAVSLGSLFLARLLVHLLLKTLDYRKFRNWRDRLPFPVLGWEHIIDNREILKAERWNLDVGVAISLKPSVEREALKVIDDALYLLIAEANKSFYELNFSQSGFSGDICKKWAKTGPLEARGSACGYILGLVYRLCTVHLPGIHKKWGVIQAVHVDFAGDVHHCRSVEIPIY